MCALAGKRWSKKGGLSLAGIHKVRASDVLLYRSMSPNVRRELAPWFQGALWMVARDGLLGRA